MSAAYARGFSGALRGALDVGDAPPLELVADESVGDLYRACEGSLARVGTSIDSMERVRRDLAWLRVPVLMRRPVDDLIRLALEAIEDSLQVARAARRALDERPTWEALEAARLCTLARLCELHELREPSGGLA